MSDMALTDGAVVTLHPLSIVRGRDGEHEVGRVETGVYVGLPSEGVDLIGWLQAGLPAGKVKEAFAGRYGQPPELDDFLAGLNACGFVRSIDGRSVTEDEAASGGGARRGWRVLAGLPAERVAWLLSPPMRLLYWVIWLTVPVLFLLRPDLLPSPDDVMINSRVTVSALALAVLGWGLVFLHELAHLLTARARGCGSSISVSRRLYFLVAQTDLTAVRSLPHSQRYAAYLAGMTWDMGVILACTLLRLAGIPPGLAAAVTYIAVVGIVFQCAFFMRTDLYLVFVNWLRLGNLAEDTHHWLANVAHRVLRRPEPHDLSHIPAREVCVIRWYAGFYMVGVLVALGALLFLSLPVTVRLLGEAAADLTLGPAQPAFWDGAGLVLLATLNLGLLLVVWWRERRVQRR